MPESGSKRLMVPIGGVLLAGVLLLVRPQYFADYSALGALIIAEFLLLAVAKYRQAFFPVLITAFVYAGVDLPFRAAFLYVRWVVLGIGGVVGVAIYLRDRSHHFGAFHLVAFFCVLSGVASALVSAYPEEAVLKTLSLTLLFVYAASGGRAAMSADPGLFFRRILFGCEVLNGFIAVCYFVFRWQFWGSPNSLGATMGVAIVPMMLWGLISAETAWRRRRLAAGLGFAVLLLMSSFARASIGAATISCVLLLIGLRQYRLLVKTAVATFVLALVAVMFVPPRSEVPQWDGLEPIQAMFLYKGHQESGVLGSRRGVWGQTWDSIKKNPWFGSGFGTSITTVDLTKLVFAKSHVDTWVGREHGNSYLAITEWVGLLGVIPFYALVLMAASDVRKVFSWMRRTGDGFSPAVPAAAVVLAGLLHAAFEDWMFAVGYYLSVFFWTMAFILVDLVPRTGVVYASEAPMLPDPEFQTAPSVL